MALRRHAHRFAGLSGQFGLTQAAQLSTETENALDDANLSGCARRLLTEAAAAVAEVERRLDLEPELLPPRRAHPYRHDRANAEREPMSSRTPTIYVVEDVATIAETYKSYLQSDRTPCSVEIFETGSAALSAIDKAAPSVILLDVQLPDMNGLDILRQIKARNVPVEGSSSPAKGRSIWRSRRCATARSTSW